LDEFDGRGGAVGGVGHLEACEAEGGVGSLKHLGDGEIAVVSVGVVVAAGELSAVVSSVVPPVNAGDLGGDRQAASEHAARVVEDLRAVLQEHIGVPVHEEATIGGGIVVPGAVLEEGRVRRDGVVVARAARTTVAPLCVTHVEGRRLETMHHVHIVALERAHTTI